MEYCIYVKISIVKNDPFCINLKLIIAANAAFDKKNLEVVDSPMRHETREGPMLPHVELKDQYPAEWKEASVLVNILNYYGSILHPYIFVLFQKVF